MQRPISNVNSEATPTAPEQIIRLTLQRVVSLRSQIVLIILIEKMELISVKDRLPVFGQAVLVHFKNKIPKFKISCLHAIEAKRNVFVIPLSGCIEEEFTESITHWMPLPKPPKP